MNLQETITELSRQREEAKGQIIAAKEKIRTLGLKIRKMETLMKNANDILGGDENDPLSKGGIVHDRLDPLDTGIDFERL